MSPENFKAARNALGLSSAQLGRILDVSPQTIRKWEAADDRASARGVNPTAARVMSWLLAGFRPPQWPEGRP